MRILHILDHSLPLHSGYTFRTRAIMRAQLAKGWAAAGVTGPRYNASSPADEVVDDLHFFRTDATRSSLPLLGEWQEVRALARRVEEVAQSFKPDILHAHSPVINGLAGLKVAKKLGLPLLYEIRAFWEDAAVGNGTGTEGSARYRLIKALETHVCRKASAVAVICDGLRKDLISRGIADSKIMVSPNGVDLDMFGNPPPPDQALLQELGYNGCDVIGFIGSFYDYEGLDDLIAAMPRLAVLRPNVRLLLVGGGPMEAALKAQVAASPAASLIHFTGRVPHQEVDRYYSLIDVLAYPRKSMRLTDLVTPLKPLEAMAQRRLVAASDVGGHRELITDGVTGTLFPAGDPPAIANALAGLLEKRESWPQRLEAGRDYVEQHRNWSSNISRYSPVYKKILTVKI